MKHLGQQMTRLETSSVVGHQGVGDGVCAQEKPLKGRRVASRQDTSGVTPETVVSSGLPGADVQALPQHVCSFIRADPQACPGSGTRCLPACSFACTGVSFPHSETHQSDEKS